MVCKKIMSTTVAIATLLAGMSISVSADYDSAVSDISAVNVYAEEETVPSDEYDGPGDPAGEFILKIRDAAYIARTLARGEEIEYSEHYDLNEDGVINIRDAAAIARSLAIK